ncbi:MAG: Fic family protein [Nitriliruptor sp.]|nr:MAG: Fic family protein [Nitriliruptor sp.]
MGLLHAQFETIDPFGDGNGRVGRLPIPFLLTGWDALSHPLLHLSGPLRRHVDEYDSRRRSIRDDGDWEGWLALFLDGVTDTATEAASTVRTILDLRERDRQRIAELGQRDANGYRLRDHRFSGPSPPQRTPKRRWTSANRPPTDSCATAITEDMKVAAVSEPGRRERVTTPTGDPRT